MTFVIFHGSFGSPEGNWFPSLKENLECLGQEVIIPRFPIDDWGKITGKQNLESWFSSFEDYLPALQKSKNLIFVGHSLGPLFILRVLEKYDLHLDACILVSPFLTVGDKYPEFVKVCETFVKEGWDWSALKEKTGKTYVLCSDDDPYVPKSDSLDFARNLNASVIDVKSGGHMNLDTVNLSEFPLVLELCKSRIDMTLYQRYLTHRFEAFRVEQMRHFGEQIITFKADEIQDEGTFHFRNLEKCGFALWAAHWNFWDPHSIYMTESRRAAERVPITRVFVLENESLTDLIKEQITLDLQAGIKVFILDEKKFPSHITEDDFGIWDEAYVCYVRGRNGVVESCTLSSRSEDIAQALEWQEEILKLSRQITSLDELAL